MTATDPIANLKYIQNYNGLKVNVHKNLSGERLQEAIQEMQEKVKENTK